MYVKINLYNKICIIFCILLLFKINNLKIFYLCFLFQTKTTHYPILYYNFFTHMSLSLFQRSKHPLKLKNLFDSSPINQQNSHTNIETGLIRNKILSRLFYFYLSMVIEIKYSVGDFEQVSRLFLSQCREHIFILRRRVRIR